MAIAVLNILSQASGKVGAIVFSRNRYASTIIRAFTPPVDPASADQLTTRASFTAAVDAWHTRGTLDHSSWNQYASMTPWFNRLGQECRLTGFNMYVGVYMHNKTFTPGFSIAALDESPPNPGLLPMMGVSFGIPLPPTPPITGFRIFVTNFSESSFVSASVWMSHGHPLTKNFYKGPYDPGTLLKIANIAPTFTSNRTIAPLTPDTRSFLRLRCFSSTTRHRISRYQYCHVDTVSN